MPRLATDGMLVAGDAASMCLAAGLWLEGVNFAIGAGLAAGRTAAEAIAAGDTSARGLAGYRRQLESCFVLADHKRLRNAADIDPGFEGKPNGARGKTGLAAYPRRGPVRTKPYKAP